MTSEPSNESHTSPPPPPPPLPDDPKAMIEPRMVQNAEPIDPDRYIRGK